MRVRTAAWSVSTAGALLALSAPAAAADARFTWTRDAGSQACPAQEAMRAAVAARLGRDPFVGEGRAIEGSVARAGNAYHARVILRDPSGAVLGTRDLDGDATAGCDALADAVALAMAIAVDPERALRSAPQAAAAPAAAPAPASEPEARPASAAAAAPPPSAPGATSTPAASSGAVDARPPPSTSARPSVERSRGERSSGEPRAAASGEALARAHATLGLLPHPSLGASVDGRWLALPHVAVEVGVLWLPSAKTVDGAFTVGASAVRGGLCAGSWTGAARRRAGVDVGACVRAVVGALDVAPRASSVDDPGQHAWAAASFDGGVTVTPSASAPLVFELAVAGYVPFVRDVFRDGASPHDGFQQAVVAGALSLGMGVSFP